MKKILLVAAIALSTLTANAQDKKESKGLQGVWWAAGQLSTANTKDGAGNKTANTTILPIVGTFVSPDVTIGLGIGNIGTKTTPVVGEATSGNTFVVEPLVRKYWNISGGLFFYGQAALPMTFGKDAAKTKTTSVSLDFAPGFDYVINKWMTVETSFSIANIGSTSTTPEGGATSSTFGLNVNPFDMNPGSRSVGGLRLGVKFLF
jgi:hypothetical protein